MKFKAYLAALTVYALGICVPLNGHASECSTVIRTIQLTPEIRSKLIIDHKIWIANNAYEDFPIKHILPGYTMVAKLDNGMTAEANIYLVRSPKGELEIVKKFKKPKYHWPATDHAYSLNELNQFGVNTIKILEVNDENRFLRLQYVEGFDIEKLYYKDDKSTSLLPEERTFIWNQFSSFKGTFTRIKDPTFILNMSNVVMEISTGNLYIIDPH